MGLTKDYLRYTVSDKFGQISGNKANIVVLHWRGTDDRYCATGVVEDIIVWDLRTGNAVGIFQLKSLPELLIGATSERGQV